MNSYELLAAIARLNFSDRSVAIIGAGYMARQYAIALSHMKVQNVTVISNSETRAKELCKEYGFRSLTCGYKNSLAKLEPMDLLMVATPIHLLLPAASMALRCGQSNVLIEKPGSLDYEKLLLLAKKLTNQRVRVGYNRVVYPNLHLLKELIQREGGATSCSFTFTEWVHTIDFTKEEPKVYSRWGISNSSHVISMVFDLIGNPKRLSARQFGKLDWHKAGSVFVGSGVTEKNIPFSYHADWNSAGRWGIDVMTKENAYRMIPLEGLYVCKKATVAWERVSFDTAYPEVKMGIAEEIAIMLDEVLRKHVDLVDLKRAAALNKLVQKIFGY